MLSTVNSYLLAGEEESNESNLFSTRTCLIVWRSWLGLLLSVSDCSLRNWPALWSDKPLLSWTGLKPTLTTKFVYLQHQHCSQSRTGWSKGCINNAINLHEWRTIKEQSWMTKLDQLKAGDCFPSVRHVSGKSRTLVNKIESVRFNRYGVRTLTAVATVGRPIKIFYGATLTEFIHDSFSDGTESARDNRPIRSNKLRSQDLLCNCWNWIILWLKEWAKADMISIFKSIRQ